jgi:hypothetical protein
VAELEHRVFGVLERQRVTRTGLLHACTVRRLSSMPQRRSWPGRGALTITLKDDGSLAFSGS